MTMPSSRKGLQVLFLDLGTWSDMVGDIEVGIDLSYTGDPELRNP